MVRGSGKPKLLNSYNDSERNPTAVISSLVGLLQDELEITLTFFFINFIVVA